MIGKWCCSATTRWHCGRRWRRTRSRWARAGHLRSNASYVGGVTGTVLANVDPELNRHDCLVLDTYWAFHNHIRPLHPSHSLALPRYFPSASLSQCTLSSAPLDPEGRGLYAVEDVLAHFDHPPPDSPLLVCLKTSHLA